jgi:4a-hydroxytetrahydrobiopterin dehydratase
MTELLDHAEIDAALDARGINWERQGDELVKVVKKHGFYGAMEYINAVGTIAEAAGHHPDILIHWDTVTLRLWTHSAGGLTAKDLKLAALIDTLDDEG